MADTAPGLARQASISQTAPSAASAATTATTTTAAAAAATTPASKQVSLKALAYLLNETVAHAVKSTIRARSGDGSKPFADVPGRVDYLKDAADVVAPSTLSYMNRIGYTVGFKTAQILLMDNTDATTIGNVSTAALVENPLEAMKFICRDVWKNLFGKQMDNLRTNHIGTFVLVDNRPVPYASCHFYEATAAATTTILDASAPGSSSNTPRNPTVSSFNALPGVIEQGQEQPGQDQATDPTALRARAYLEFNCGVIQGVLQCLGVGLGIAGVSVQSEEDGRNGGDARSVIYTVETRSA